MVAACRGVFKKRPFAPRCPAAARGFLLPFFFLYFGPPALPYDVTRLGILLSKSIIQYSNVHFRRKSKLYKSVLKFDFAF